MIAKRTIEAFMGKFGQGIAAFAAIVGIIVAIMPDRLSLLVYDNDTSMYISHKR